MPTSNSLLNNHRFNNLVVNRLESHAISSNNILSQTPSYLFSAVFNGQFARNSLGGTLTFNNSDVISIIRFTDRPIKQSAIISFEQFVSLFGIFNGVSNTFAEDPPNAVLVHEEEQRTYTVTLISSDLIDSNSVKFNLELIPGESHNLTDINGRMSLFLDSTSISTTSSTSTFLTQIPPLTKNKTYNINYQNSNGNFNIKIPFNKSLEDIYYLFGNNYTIFKSNGIVVLQQEVNENFYTSRVISITEVS